METLDQQVADNQGPAGILDIPEVSEPVAPVALPVAKETKYWYDSLSDDLKNNPSIQKFKTQEDVAKSYLELQTLVGHKKVALPKDDKDEVGIKNFNKAIGVPDEPKGYKLEPPVPPAGMEGMVFGLDEFKAIAHKEGLTPRQANNLMAEYVNMLGKIHEKSAKEFQTSVESSKAELTKEWGLAFDGKVKLAQSVLNKFAGDKETFDYLNAKIGTDPVALRWLAKVGENFTEGTLGSLGTPKSQFTKTPAEAKEEYEKIMADSNDIYWSGVRNKELVPESARKARITYVESLLKMQLGQAK